MLFSSEKNSAGQYTIYKIMAAVLVVSFWQIVHPFSPPLIAICSVGEINNGGKNGEAFTGVNSNDYNKTRLPKYYIGNHMDIIATVTSASTCSYNHKPQHVAL